MHAGGGKQKNKGNASSPKGGKRRDSDLMAKEELLKALTRQAEENTRILERERAQRLADEIRTVELGGGHSGLPPPPTASRPPPAAGGKKGPAPALQVGHKGGASRAHVFMPQQQGTQAIRYDPSMIPGLEGGGGGPGSQDTLDRPHPFAPPIQIAPSPSGLGGGGGGPGRGGKFLGGARPPSTLEGTFPDTPGFFPGMMFAVPSGGGGPPSPSPGQYMHPPPAATMGPGGGYEGGYPQGHEGVGGWMAQGPPEPYYPPQSPPPPYSMSSPSGGYPQGPQGGYGGPAPPPPQGSWVSPPPTLHAQPGGHSQMMPGHSPYGMDPSPPQPQGHGRKSAFMGALTDIRAGPTEEQRRHREDQRAQLQRDLDEQIRQKRDKEARIRADEERQRAKEEAEHRAYVEKMRLQHEAEVRARRGEEEEGEGEGQGQEDPFQQQQQHSYHSYQNQQQPHGYYSNSHQGYNQGPPSFPQQSAPPPQKFQPPSRAAAAGPPPQANSAPVVKKAGDPFGSVAVDDSGGHVVARRKNKKVIDADWLDAGGGGQPAYDPTPPPPPRPPSPPTKASAAKPVVVKAGGPFGSVAVDDSGGHILAKNKNRHKRIIEADWLDQIPAPSSSHPHPDQEPPNPLAAIVRRSIESHPPAPGPSISPRGHNSTHQGGLKGSGGKERGSVGTSGGSMKGEVAVMLMELQKEQVRLRDEFKKHSEAMQKIVQGAGDVASSRDRAWQDLDRIRSRLSANVGEVAALGASLGGGGGGGAFAESSGEFKVVSTHLLPRDANAIPSRLTTPIEAQWIQDEIQELQMGHGDVGLYGIGEEDEAGDYLNLDDGLYHHLGQSRSRPLAQQDQRGARGRGPPPVASNIPTGITRIASRGIMGGFGGGGGGGGAVEKKPAPVAFGRRAAAAPPASKAASSPKGRNSSSARPSGADQPAFGRRATKPPMGPSSARGRN